MSQEGPRKHPVDEMLPVPRLALYGFQHVLAFYAGAVVVPILVAGAIGLSTEQLVYLINADLFTCGIASIIQSLGFWKIGIRLPIVQGVTFTAVAPMIAIGQGAENGTAGLLAIYGATITAGVLTFLAAPFLGRLLRFFPPLVTGTVLTIMGLILLPNALNDAAGGAAAKTVTKDFGSWKHLMYAGGTLLFILVLYRLRRPFLSSVAVLLGLVGGTAVSFVLGDTGFDQVGKSDWIGVTTPFHYGAPTFQIGAILAMLLVMMVTVVETVGDSKATGEIVGKDVDGADITRALRADGLSTFLGGSLNAFPYTCFAQNVGLVRLTGVRSRFVVVAAGAFMIVLGLFPKAGAYVASIPSDVLGGAAVAMFGMVAVVGVQTLAKVDLRQERNALVVGVSIALAMLPNAVPEFGANMPRDVAAILNSGITLGSLSAIVLNLLFNVLTRTPQPSGEEETPPAEPVTAT
ncbi:MULTISPECIES: nucleobase:cation symporter-2 family protein [Thermomonosporaceae]|uniref:nucleobase:cation symporter-2 family protein n=1 Tax=Thermomonosporaceae TaxID=2012 RepID=UPI00255AB700|nr:MULTISPECIES: nucleobase:cation symporter-2 family protein [Thermomonosporaceae]MDL4774045.1 nucleobase:cation symporter-2 family protein [Actinomadura xylanilytica]